MIGAELEKLIKLLSKLPGLGPRSARRVALHLLKKRDDLMYPLANAIEEAAQTISHCHICGNLDTQNPCSICCDERRQKDVICVVEQVGDLWALERSGAFHGRYHVLGGTLSALDGISPEDLKIPKLIERSLQPEVTEIILALNATVDGQTTAHYLADKLQRHENTTRPLKISRLARGVPIGGELDYLDDGTLMAALKARSHVE